jgi:excisionase family DNA binding protein
VTLQHEEIYTAEELAKLLKVKPYRVQELARINILPHFRLGRQLRFPATAIKAFIESGGKTLPGGWRRKQAR